MPKVDLAPIKQLIGVKVNELNQLKAKLRRPDNVGKVEALIEHLEELVDQIHEPHAACPSMECVFEEEGFEKP